MDGLLVCFSLSIRNPWDPSEQRGTGILGQQRLCKSVELASFDLLGTGIESDQRADNAQPVGERAANGMKSLLGIKLELHLEQLPLVHHQCQIDQKREHHTADADDQQ